MNIKKLAGIIILIVVFLMGCVGPSGKLKTQSITDSKVTLQELIDNWTEYDIWFQSAVIVFDKKNDDKKLLVDGTWGTVKDQETWTGIVNANTMGDGSINPAGANYTMTGVREVWSPDNHFYGYIIHEQPDSVSVRVVDENTMRVYYQRAHFGTGR